MTSNTDRVTGTDLPLTDDPVFAALLRQIAAWEPGQATRFEVPIGAEFGPYCVRSELGRGAMGVVLRAFDRRLGRDVALKVTRLSRGLALHEARAAASLSHPNIAVIYDFGESDNQAWIAMELVDGASLRHLLGKGRLRPAQVLPILRAISEGLAAAHSRGVIHRDLKPENLAMNREGVWKILDFGIAALPADYEQHFDERSQAPSPHAATPAYAPIEQVRGEAACPADDVYALGMIAREMLTGSRRGELSTLPESWQSIIRRATATGPGSEQRALDAGYWVRSLATLSRQHRLRRPWTSGHNLTRWLQDDDAQTRDRARWRRVFFTVALVGVVMVAAWPRLSASLLSRNNWATASSWMDRMTMPRWPGQDPIAEPHSAASSASSPLHWVTQALVAPSADDTHLLAVGPDATYYSYHRGEVLLRTWLRDGALPQPSRSLFASARKPALVVHPLDSSQLLVGRGKTSGIEVFDRTRLAFVDTFELHAVPCIDSLLGIPGSPQLLIGCAGKWYELSLHDRTTNELRLPATSAEIAVAPDGQELALLDKSESTWMLRQAHTAGGLPAHNSTRALDWKLLRTTTGLRQAGNHAAVAFDHHGRLFAAEQPTGQLAGIYQVTPSDTRLWDAPPAAVIVSLQALADEYHFLVELVVETRSGPVHELVDIRGQVPGEPVEPR